MRPPSIMSAVFFLMLISLAMVEIGHSASRAVGDKARGKELFDTWCAPCHAPGPNHPGTQALDAKYMGKLPAALEERRDLTAGVVKNFVRQGVSIMPFFRQTEINDADLSALGAYLTKK